MTAAQVDFDPFSDDFFNSPYDTYRSLREHAPVYYSERYKFYALTRYADVAAAYKDYSTFSSAYGVDLEQVREGQVTNAGSIISMDPPEHRQMRSLLNRVFTPRAIMNKKELVVNLIQKHLDEVDPAGFDFVQEFCALFPIEVITTLQNVPEDDRQQIRQWIDDFLHRDHGQVGRNELAISSSTEMFLYYQTLVTQRRAEPGDDLLSRLIGAEMERENGESTPLTDTEIVLFSMLLGGAGAETVAKLLGNAAVVFAQFPDQWEKLLQDRSKLPLAVEELLRYEAPAQYNLRYTLRDVTLHGVTIPAGSPTFLVAGSANRDPDAWTDPDRFDIDRDRNQAQNLGFGYGIHSCLGAALARLETAVALDKILDFMPRYEVDWDRCVRVNMQNVAGWRNVPVRVLR